MEGREGIWGSLVVPSLRLMSTCVNTSILPCYSDDGVYSDVKLLGYFYWTVVSFSDVVFTDCLTLLQETTVQWISIISRVSCILRTL